MDYALLLVAPVVGFFVLAKLLGDRPMPHLGPWIAALTGAWGACTARPLEPLARIDFPSISTAIAFFAVAFVFATIVWRGAPKVGSDALLPLGLWWVASEVAYALGNSAVEVAVAVGWQGMTEPSRLFLVAAFVVVGGGAAFTSSSPA